MFVLIFAAGLCPAQIAMVVDPPPLFRVMDDFNDGVDTSTGYGNASSAGEAGGVMRVTVPASASDPQVRFPSAGTPFDIATYPFFRIYSRAGFGAASQVFPLPPSGTTVVGFSTGASFAESRLTFVTAPPGADGTGLRIDPIMTGGPTPEVFEYDYIHLDKFETIGIAEYDRDGGTEGFEIIGNGHITNVQVRASTGTLSGTTAGVDPIMQRAGLSVDAGKYNVLEVRAAFDPLSKPRFEVFWGTSLHPGPAGGQSLVVDGGHARLRADGR